jgi:hypothetical protein
MMFASFPQKPSNKLEGRRAEETQPLQIREDRARMALL